MAYLDGKVVGDKEIDPAKHRFIGKFRHPSIGAFMETFGPSYDVIACPCGRNLWTREETYDHWLQGHFDTSMYESILKEAV